MPYRQERRGCRRRLQGEDRVPQVRDHALRDVRHRPADAERQRVMVNVNSGSNQCDKNLALVVLFSSKVMQKGQAYNVTKDIII